jgi:peroxiredoxin
MGKTEKKKSLREKQRERQVKQQRASEAYKAQREREVKRRPRKWPKGKLILGICLIALIFTTYGAWQYYEGQKPPSIGGATDKPSSVGLAPDFSLQDINGNSVSLSQFSGKVIGIHFMAVGCGGQINPINQYQLAQLKSACSSFCSDESVAFLTVAVATCANSALDQIRADYGVAWALGNDYADGVLDIVNSYIPYSIGDGAVVLIDRDFNVAQVYTGGVSAQTLSSRIGQLVEA